MTVPQMQKSDIADNQQGKALSYVYGVLFSDGWVDSRRSCFHCRSIDSDILDKLEKEIARCGIPYDKIARYAHAQNPDAYGSKDIELLSVTGDFGRILRSVSHRTTVIPSVVYESEDNTRAFLTGLIDGDGWFSIYESKGVIRFEVGIAKTSEMMYEVPALLKTVGINHQKIATRKLKSGKVLKRLRFTPQSFLASGLCFSAKRKQRRVDMMRQIYALLAQAKVKMDRETFNDYKREVLSHVA